LRAVHPEGGAVTDWLWIGLLVLAAAVLFLWSARKRRQTGLPTGKIVYADTDAWQKLPAPLYDPSLRLTGKPDYVVDIGGGVRVPVEVKSASAPDEPYDSHVMQLAAYCLLLERGSGKRPPYGLLRYRDRTFRVDYTPGLEESLLNLISSVRAAENCPDGPPRSHVQASRCRACGYRQHCTQALD
jgi:CRISPR-associated exonuclease Cas4